MDSTPDLPLRPEIPDLQPSGAQLAEEGAPQPGLEIPDGSHGLGESFVEGPVTLEA